jgi:hypothetical protein
MDRPINVCGFTSVFSDLSVIKFPIRSLVPPTVGPAVTMPACP